MCFFFRIVIFEVKDVRGTLILVEKCYDFSIKLIFVEEVKMEVVLGCARLLVWRKSNFV